MASEKVRRLRVAMVSGEYPPGAGGVGDYTALLVEHLGHLGVAARVITTPPLRAPTPLSTQHSALSTSEVAYVRTWGPACWPRVARLAKGCEVVHLQYQAAAYGLRGAATLLPLWLRLARPAVRVVTTFHDLRVPYLFPRAGSLRALAVRTLLHGSHAAIFSDHEDLLVAGTGPGRHWIPIGSNIASLPQSAQARAALRHALGVAPEETLVGYFGFVNASKGLETLVEALERLRAGGCPARLLLVGDQIGASDPTNRATAARLEARLAELGSGQAVSGTGWLPSEAVSAHLQACDLVALPFLEGASLRRGSLIAALVHGLPTVTTVRRGPAPPADSPYALRDGQHALLVPPGDPAALAQAIRRLAADEPLRRRLAEGARALGAHFSWPAIARATLEVYEAQ